MRLLRRDLRTQVQRDEHRVHEESDEQHRRSAGHVLPEHHQIQRHGHVHQPRADDRQEADEEGHDGQHDGERDVPQQVHAQHDRRLEELGEERGVEGAVDDRPDVSADRPLEVAVAPRHLAAEVADHALVVRQDVEGRDQEHRDRDGDDPERFL